MKIFVYILQQQQQQKELAFFLSLIYLFICIHSVSSIDDRFVDENRHTFEGRIVNNEKENLL